jgi:hypothetical protein
MAGKVHTVTTFSVKKTDLEAALASSRSEAAQILELVNGVQRQLQATTFVGETAERLSKEMDTKMGEFVLASYSNVDEVLRLIVDYMNVVVTKLGGDAWGHVVVERGSTVASETMRKSGGQDYEIDIDSMETYARMVDEQFESIAAGYMRIQATISDGTPGWQGPEKVATVNAVNEAVQIILGTAGGETGVRGVGSSLSGLLREQISLMQTT